MPVQYAVELKYERELTRATTDETGRVGSLLPAQQAFGGMGTTLDFPAVEERTVYADALSGHRILLSELVQSYNRAYEKVGSQVAVRSEGAPWKQDALELLESVYDRYEDDRPLPAEFVFVASLDEPAFADFMSRARKLLADPNTVSAAWHAFLDAEATAAVESTRHDFLPPLDDNHTDDDVTSAVKSALITAADLRSRLRGGAMRGRTAPIGF